MKTNTVTHIAGPSEATASMLERLKKVATYYTNHGMEVPADLYVASSFLQLGVFGSQKQKEAQVVWIKRTVKRAEAVAAEDRLSKSVAQTADERAIAEGIKTVAESKNQPKRRAPAKKATPAKRAPAKEAAPASA